MLSREGIYCLGGSSPELCHNMPQIELYALKRQQEGVRETASRSIPAFQHVLICLLLVVSVPRS